MRFLNAVGGGKVVRISGDIAYVDEDGFETPVLVRECVVIAHAQDAEMAKTKSTDPRPKAFAKETGPSAPVKIPVIERANGDVLNLVLGFEASDLKSLSRSSFDAVLVNDSNYYVYLAVLSRSADDSQWTLRFAGEVEPNIQEFIFELNTADLAAFDRVKVQYLAYKKDKGFEAKTPGECEIKIDTTKFAKLHCFRPNPYFDVPVIAFDIAVKDATPVDFLEAIRNSGAPKKESAQPKKSSKPAAVRRNDEIVVDLHVSELFDNVNGLSNSDILNAQLDRFEEVMKANLRNVGQKIVFIHGKGEGVLRQAILKELNHRYKGHDVQDASFQEYGFGATQVTIRQQGQAPYKPRQRR